MDREIDRQISCVSVCSYIGLYVSLSFLHLMQARGMCMAVRVIRMQEEGREIERASCRREEGTPDLCVGVR